MRTASVSALLLVLLLAFLAVAWTTHGFSAVTSEGVRRAQLRNEPRRLPALSLRFADGRAEGLREATSHRPLTLVSLVYTRCNTMCRVTGSSEAWLQAQLRQRGLAPHVGMLTLSFDPGHDGPQVLDAYATRMRADPDVWSFATVTSPSELPRLLKAFDVVVIPDGLGGFEHNGALFVVDSTGRLLDAFDVDAPDQALEYVARHARAVQ